MTFNARRSMRVCAGLLTVTLLGGCASGLRSDVPAVVTYRLQAAAPSLGETPIKASLRVDRAVAGPGYATDRILVLRDDRQLDYYSASRWPATLPEIVSALAVESLRGGGGLAAVHDDSAPFTSDYLLVIGVRRFEAETANDGLQVRVLLDCTVGRRKDRGVVAAFTAEGTAAVGEERMSAVIAAFEQATQQAMSMLTSSTLAAVKSDTIDQ